MTALVLPVTETAGRLWSSGDASTGTLFRSCDWLCAPSPCCAWIVSVHGPGALYSVRRQLRALHARLGVKWVCFGTENPAVACWAGRLGVPEVSFDGERYGRFFGPAGKLLAVARAFEG